MTFQMHMKARPRRQPGSLPERHCPGVGVLAGRAPVFPMEAARSEAALEQERVSSRRWDLLGARHNTVEIDISHSLLLLYGPLF